MRTDFTADQRALFGTLYVTIDLAVGEVIDHAARRAHEEYACHEDEQRVQRRRALACDPDRPQGWPQQQINADRLVDTCQLDKIPGAWAQAIEGFEQGQVHQAWSLL
ncbi:hypothetical protein ALP29_200506 [Pseudomonas syringae pv. avii]|uniref:Uncharacterized protein n=1 Tax=Pseudomonas syringae pv. avii TaxID=663959 RepID=A0A3M5VP59_PSESX|nr:hypothetical protein ALP29_200506 [Pseudomonas syringae pv. avii]